MTSKACHMQKEESMIKLAPSILSANFANLEEDIKQVEQAGAEYLHIDVMDGAFVPSISFGAPVMKCIRPISNLVFDVHLMVEEPIRYIDDFVKAGADIITIHAEACKHLNRTIARIKESGVKVGVSLNPSTSLSVLDYCLEDIDMVLIMSVNPGFGGQKFLPLAVDKIKTLKELIRVKNLNVDIQVDGGINTNNVSEIIEAGGNVIVAGTAVFGGDIVKNVNNFKDIFSKY